MLKRITAIILTVLTLTLTGCVATGTGFQSYVDTSDGYQFLYPNGWVPVTVNNGPDVVFHDLIEETENVSVIISSVPKDKLLTSIGTPTEVGYQLSKNAIAPPDSGREAELVDAEAREVNGKTYYLLEYAVTLPNQKRHNFASVAISRGKLFTFNLSTTENRFSKLEDLFKQVVKSFSVY